MTKHFVIISTLISIAECAFAQEFIQNSVSKEDREIIILMARPEEKSILVDFLTAPDMTKQDAVKVRNILKRMIHETESRKPMMTKSFKGE